MAAILSLPQCVKWIPALFLDRPYVCQLCGKAYKEKTLLKNHMESHGGVKKYLCQVICKEINTLRWNYAEGIR